jgi:hypothetical protein
MKDYLNREIQDGNGKTNKLFRYFILVLSFLVTDGHDSVQDTVAALELFAYQLSLFQAQGGNGQITTETVEEEENNAENNESLKFTLFDYLLFKYQVNEDFVDSDSLLSKIFLEFSLSSWRRRSSREEEESVFQYFGKSHLQRVASLGEECFRIQVVFINEFLFAFN